MRHYAIVLLLGVFSLHTLHLLAQTADQPTPTAAADRANAARTSSLVSELPFTNIGPAVQSGRVADLAVNPADPTHFYVAYASGGLWYTENNGTSFRPLFDQQSVMTIGAIAVDWERNTIWVGTGEVNSSRSSYAGNGIYSSKDAGQTWQYHGLPETHHIGRIVLHPTDPATVWVAALGHLYSPNPERGIYRTTDGGKTWQHALRVDNNTGAVDLAVHPSNPRQLYASTWERSRQAWDFTESGAGSAVYGSSDGGATWQRLTNERSGFPTGEGAGRIGVAVTEQDGQTVIYASIDNYFRRDKEAAEPDLVTKEMLRTMPTEDVLRLKDYLLEDFLRSNSFPRDLTAKEVRRKLEQKEISPLDLVTYLEDANSLLFDTDVKGLEVYRSVDNGQSWKRTHKDYLDAVYNTYGYYFGQIVVAPYDADQVYVMGVPILRSADGGQSWKGINGGNVHADHHALWINPARPGHLINGNDGGVNISYDYGQSWIKCNTPAVGQFYYVAVDMAEPYRVYGGLQDNGVWMGPHEYEASADWYQDGQYPYRAIMGGDGMQVAVDTRDNNTVYTGFQFGNYFRINTRTEKREYISPRHELGERPFRWNWQAPIHLSVHNQDVLYMGSNFVHRSLNQGTDFTKISDDLTLGGRKGDVPYGTLSALHESPRRFGLLYAGSDDGLVHVSRDGGYSWQRITAGLPANYWVSRIQASSHVDGRVYLSLNGYRWDNFASLVYQSNDYGQTWTRIGTSLPAEPVNVIKEDPTNADLLYVGTDHGLYLSLDQGQTFVETGTTLPRVAVHDVVIHPRDKEMIVGTHGRSLYRAPVGELQQLNGEVRARAIHVFAVAKRRASGRWGSFSWFNNGENNDPSLAIPVYVNQGGEVELKVVAADGQVLQTQKMPVSTGLNYLDYDLSIDPKRVEDYNRLLNKERKEDTKPIRVKAADNGKVYLTKGEYTLRVSKNGQTSETKLLLE